MNKHLESMHKDKRKAAQDNGEDEEEDIVFCCTKCKFETNREKKLTDHIKRKHESYICDECDLNMDSSNKLIEHKRREHLQIDCEICNFKTKSKQEMDSHVENMHNKMFACDNCNFEATSKKILQDHIRCNHKTEEDFSCSKCSYKTILEHNLSEHIKNKHTGEKESQGTGRENVKSEETPCIYWNRGHCSSSNCRFPHKEIPACHYQNNCTNTQCPFYHFNKSLNTFLGRGHARPQTRRN